MPCTGLALRVSQVHRVGAFFLNIQHPDAMQGTAIGPIGTVVRWVLALVEQSFADALTDQQGSGAAGDISGTPLTQRHALTRGRDEYADLCVRAATASTAAVAANTTTTYSQ